MKVITSVKQLQSAKRKLSIPFTLALPNDEIQVIKPLRLLPGKRLTALAYWQGKQVIAKLFYHPKRWRKYGMQDAYGINALVLNDIETPELLYQSSKSIAGLYFILYEYLSEAINLRDALNVTNTEDEHNKLVEALVEKIAQLHGANIVHHDLHLDNFLLANGTIYTIDGDEIKQYERAIPLKKSLENLATLFAHLPIKVDAKLKRLLERYCGIRGWSLNKEVLTLASHEIYQARLNHYKNRKKKVFRSCTEFNVHNTFFKKIICQREHYDGIKQLLLNPENEFVSNAKAYLKQGNTCTLVKTNMIGKELVIKRYNIKSLWHGLKRGFRKSRAAYSWQNAHMLKNLGVRTAEPIALIEKRFGPWRRQAYYICEYLPGTPLTEFIRNSDQQLHLIDQLIDLFNDLCLAHVSHGDMKADNFIMAHEKELTLIDLDSMLRHSNKKHWLQRWEKDMHRFLKNWESEPEVFETVQQQLSKEDLI